MCVSVLYYDMMWQAGSGTVVGVLSRDIQYLYMEPRAGNGFKCTLSHKGFHKVEVAIVLSRT